jgi:tetratricopeptide (TPR) repeat protein
MRFAYGLILIALLTLSAASALAQNLVDGETLHPLEAAQKAVHAEPDSETNRLDLASRYLKAGWNRSAVDTLKVYLQVHPDAPSTLRLISVAYLREDDYAAAKDAAERALRFGPRDSAGVQILAMAQLGLGATNSAETLFREALQLDPRSVEANLQLGLLYTKQRKNLNEAIRLLEKARSLQPNVAETYPALGSALLQSGNARQAAGYLETAIRLAPDSADAYYVLATAYRQLHDDAKADATLASFNAHKKADADQRAREMRSRASTKRASIFSQIPLSWIRLTLLYPKPRVSFPLSIPPITAWPKLVTLRAIFRVRSLPSVKLCGSIRLRRNTTMFWPVVCKRAIVPLLSRPLRRH